MKKIFYAVLAAVLALPLQANGQDLLRANYKKNGYVFTSSERVRVEGETPLEVKLEKVTFPDKGILYKLHVDVEDGSAWKMPKNAPMTIATTSGKTVILKNYFDQANLIAPNGIKKGNDRVWWNCGEFYMEQVDLDKILEGVSSVEITKRWSSSGVIRNNYKDNEFGKAVASEYQAIRSAGPAKVEASSSNLQSITDLHGNRHVEGKRMDVECKGSFGARTTIQVGLTYLYYADSNTESYDLYIFPEGITVPDGGKVTFTLTNGEEIELKQEQELPAGKVLCYPTPDQLKRLLTGVARITLQTVSSERTLTFSGQALSEKLALLYESIQTAAIL